MAIAISVHQMTFDVMFQSMTFEKVSLGVYEIAAYYEVEVQIKHN